VFFGFENAKLMIIHRLENFLGRKLHPNVHFWHKVILSGTQIAIISFKIANFARFLLDLV